MDKTKYIVEKSNILNNFKCRPKENMTLNELRFFCMFVSRLNPLDREQRTIDIKISEFEKLFNVKLNTTEFSQTLNRILSRSMYIYNEKTKKNRLINLYSLFEWSDGFENNIISISANYDIVPYLWDLKSNYTAYNLENIAKLSSVSRIRLYEVMTQYKKIKTVTLNLEELKEIMQCKQKDFYEFSRNSLIPAIKDINEFTDINITYEKITQKRKVIAIKFTINGKKRKVKERAISEPTEKDIPQVSTKESSSNINDCFSELYERYFKDRNFKKSDTETIIIKLTEKVNIFGAKVKQLEEVEIYLKNLMNAYDKQREKKILENKTGYILGMIEKNAFIKQEPEYRQREEQSYDINEFEKYAINYEAFKNVKEESEDVQCNPDAEEMTISESDFKAETLEQFFERVGYKR